MCSYLVYPSFPLIGVTVAVCVSGDQSSRCQWIQGLEGCSLWCNKDHGSSHRIGHFVFLEMAWCSQCSLWAPGVHSAIPGVIRACSHRDCSLRALSAEVAALGLLWQRSWLRPTLSEFPDLCPYLQRSPVPAYSLGGPRLMPGSAKVSGCILLLQCLLPCTCFCGVCCLRPASLI